MTDCHDQAAFYEKLYLTKEFNCLMLNSDEAARADAILRYIKQYVLPFFRGRDLTILDLGCGKGWLTNILSAYGKVLGADLSVTRAKELFPNLNFYSGTNSDLLSNGNFERFNLIVSTEVIEHIPDNKKKDFLCSIYSLLVPGGFAILTTPRVELYDAWQRVYPFKQPIESWISESELNRLSRSVGFNIVYRDRVFLPDRPYNWISHIAASKFLQFLKSHFPHAKIFTKLRYHCGIYQIILLQRV